MPLALRRAAAILAALAPFVAPFLAPGGGPAAAHPHGWIDVRVAVLFDPDGRVTALRQTWLFDEAYTAFVAEGADPDGDGRPNQDLLDELLTLNMQNLADYHYFTLVEQAGRSLPFGTPADLSTRIVDGRLETVFRLPLAVPAAPREAALAYKVYDPTYYLEVLHLEGGAAVHLEGAPADCHARLLPANPTAGEVAMAAALDVTDSGGEGLGALFAETVHLACGE
ncbi:MAG: DUF1007 family protein [Sneathiellaceae bacterium]